MPFGVAASSASVRDWGLVVDDRVEPGHVAQPRGFLVGSGRAYHIAALDPRDLRRDGSDGAAGGRDEDLLPVFQLAGFEKSAVSGNPSSAERVHVDGQRKRRIAFQGGYAAAVADMDFAKADALPNQLTFLEFRVARLDHPPDAAAQKRSIQRLVGV